MTYTIALIVCSLAVAAGEALWPRRRWQKQLRTRVGSDLLLLAFNVYFFGLGIGWLADRAILPTLGRTDALAHRDLVAHWPLGVQAAVALIVIDFVEWNIHRLLHAVPALWEIHKFHHSVVDGEMDWIVSFRFHWLEAVVYRALEYLPLALLGFRSEALLFHAMVATAVGHLNHSNLDLGRGAWRFVVNSPRMHLWHHARDGRPRNFGIVFSAWDWLFGTAHVPAEPPPALGFPGVEKFSRTLPAILLWPLIRRTRLVVPAKEANA